MKEIKDNRELIRKTKEEKVNPTCRVCGAKEIHSESYNKPTMDCIKHLRQRLEYAFID